MDLIRKNSGTTFGAATSASLNLERVWMLSFKHMFVGWVYSFVVSRCEVLQNVDCLLSLLGVGSVRLSIEDLSNCVHDGN